MTEVFRTPEERFEGLTEFPWQPHYSEWQGLRLARIDEGEDGARPPVVLFHGEPTWSYLYRKVIPPLLDSSRRCIAPDLPGFGRSDKPAELGWYSFDRHTEAMTALLGELELRDATFVVHDWGGPIGMRIAAENPEWCGRLVAMDTGTFSGRQRMSDAWLAFRAFVERTEDLPIGMLISGGCAGDPSPEALAGYEAPFPEVAAKHGARAFPLILPTSPDAPGAEAGARTAEALAADERPALVLWGEQDPVLPPEVGRAYAAKMNWPEPELIAAASHFLQEDQGEQIGRRIAAWLDEQGA
jgi:haloalkane dehalogenase